MPDDALVAFLRARYDERERAARFVLSDYAHHEAAWSVPSTGVVDIGEGSIADETILTGDGPLAEFIADNDPQFVLADVAAKRQIVERNEAHAKKLARLNEKNSAGTLTQDQAWQRSDLGVKLSETRRVLKLLALPFAGHPSFKEEWRA